MRTRAALALALYAVPCFAWGPEGHRLVGRIAQSLLNPDAETRVQSTLLPGETIASMASWADEIRSTRKETEPWHFIDIEITGSGLNMGRDCPRGNCVLGKITEFRKTWRDPQAAPTDRREALLFLIHFVGDMHQPLHCADNNDKGGNSTRVEFEGDRMNLHHLWDSALLDHMPAEDSLFDAWSHAITAADQAEWPRGTVEDWAEESFHAAKVVVYGGVFGSPGQVPQLGDNYERAADRTVEQQIEKAGVRLAAILNEP